MNPTLREEKRLFKKKFKIIASIDEAGRGSLAGPVVASAVLVDFYFIKKNRILKNFPVKINDSKKISSSKRKELFYFLKKQKFIKWSLGIVSEKIIDKINIQKATELAIEKAIKKLERKIKQKIEFILVDGKQLNNKNLKKYKIKSIIKGDQKVYSIALASIFAKVSRDIIMEKYDKKFPYYGFRIHKGYGTKMHFKKIKKLGPCKIHRKTFAPIKNLVS
ncbi:MAG: ribonuclease HII [Minisyncoccia bacterium]